MSEPRLETVTGSFRACSACLAGDGGECHTPGCVFWLCRAPDLPLRERLTDHGCEIGDSAPSASSPDPATGLRSAARALFAMVRRGTVRVHGDEAGIAAWDHLDALLFPIVWSAPDAEGLRLGRCGLCGSEWTRVRYMDDLAAAHARVCRGTLVAPSSPPPAPPATTCNHPVTVLRNGRETCATCVPAPGAADERGPAEDAVVGTPSRSIAGRCPCGGELVRYTGARTPQAQCLKCKAWRWPGAADEDAPEPPPVGAQFWERPPSEVDYEDAPTAPCTCLFPGRGAHEPGCLELMQSVARRAAPAAGTTPTEPPRPEGGDAIQWLGCADTVDRLNERYDPERTGRTGRRFLALGGPTTLYDRGADLAGGRRVPMGWWIHRGPDGEPVATKEPPAPPPSGAPADPAENRSNEDTINEGKEGA